MKQFAAEERAPGYNHIPAAIFGGIPLLLWPLLCLPAAMVTGDYGPTEEVSEYALSTKLIAFGVIYYPVLYFACMVYCLMSKSKPLWGVSVIGMMPILMASLLALGFCIDLYVTVYFR